jgi:hypothetical protein
MCTIIGEIIEAVAAIISVVEAAAPAVADLATALGATGLLAEGGALIAACAGDPELASMLGTVGTVLGVGAGVSGGISSAVTGLSTLANFGVTSIDPASGLAEATSGAAEMTPLEGLDATQQFLGGIAEVSLTVTGHDKAAGFLGMFNSALGMGMAVAKGSDDALGMAIGETSLGLSIGSAVAAKGGASGLASVLGLGSGAISSTAGLIGMAQAARTNYAAEFDSGMSLEAPDDQDGVGGGPVGAPPVPTPPRRGTVEASLDSSDAQSVAEPEPTASFEPPNASRELQLTATGDTYGYDFGGAQILGFHPFLNEDGQWVVPTLNGAYTLDVDPDNGSVVTELEPGDAPQYEELLQRKGTVTGYQIVRDTGLQGLSRDTGDVDDDMDSSPRVLDDTSVPVRAVGESSRANAVPLFGAPQATGPAQADDDEADASAETDPNAAFGQKFWGGGQDQESSSSASRLAMVRSWAAATGATGAGVTSGGIDVDAWNDGPSLPDDPEWEQARAEAREAIGLPPTTVPLTPSAPTSIWDLSDTDRDVVLRNMEAGASAPDPLSGPGPVNPAPFQLPPRVVHINDAPLAPVSDYLDRLHVQPQGNGLLDYIFGGIPNIPYNAAHFADFAGQSAARSEILSDRGRPSEAEDEKFNAIVGTTGAVASGLLIVPPAAAGVDALGNAATAIGRGTAEGIGAFANLGAAAGRVAADAASGYVLGDLDASMQAALADAAGADGTFGLRPQFVLDTTPATSAISGAGAAGDNVIVFRGTTDRYPGNPGLQQIGVTPTTTDPVVATLFATEASNFGEGVVYVGAVEPGLLIEGNVLAGVEAEVGVSMAPADFAAAAQPVSVEAARAALAEMGIDLPAQITGKAMLQQWLSSTPRLTPAQVEEFTQLVLQAQQGATP